METKYKKFEPVVSEYETYMCPYPKQVQKMSPTPLKRPPFKKLWDSWDRN
jgi:hypothetical protein